MRGWWAVPLMGSDGGSYGFVQVSDRIEGDFDDQDDYPAIRRNIA